MGCVVCALRQGELKVLYQNHDRRYCNGVRRAKRCTRPQILA
eukprot:COSAG01_NODE_61919_length_287_cov_0.819149_1_plen_41_part_10